MSDILLNFCCQALCKVLRIQQWIKHYHGAFVNVTKENCRAWWENIAASLEGKNKEGCPEKVIFKKISEGWIGCRQEYIDVE